MNIAIGGRARFAVALAAALTAARAPAQTAPDAATLAKAFGARPAASEVQLSPLGAQIVYLTPAGSNGTAAIVANIASGATKAVVVGSDKLRPVRCVWKTETRLICTMYGISAVTGPGLSFLRTLAVNADGSAPIALGQRDTSRTVGINQDSGNVIDMLPDDPDHILMQIFITESNDTGSNIRSNRPGASVQRVDINTGHHDIVEAGHAEVQTYGTDDHGAVRFMGTMGHNPNGYTRERIDYFYRLRDSRDWRALGAVDLTQAQHTSYLGFAEDGNALLALIPDHGRLALFSVATGAGNAATLLFAQPQVDVDEVLRIGKFNRPVAASYTLDVTEYAFFDPKLLKLSAALTKALPGGPGVTIRDESWDGAKKLVLATSATDPGHFYVYNTATHELGELVALRPDLAAIKLGRVDAVTFPAGRDAKGLPAIVMPHGGPAARDRLGFDWLAQYFASLGYVVLQPNYRGSAGYGDAWYGENGFKAWATAMADINDGARWLASNGTADPKRMAIVGWSYGGYAALQANVVDPALYRAAIAIAPVTDLAAMKEKARQYTNAAFVETMIGSGPHVAAGSPAQNAAAIRVPVLMFQGDKDINVDISQARIMDSALTAAHKPHELVIYPGLDHQLDDSDARTDMLTRSAAFLAANMGAPN